MLPSLTCLRVSVDFLGASFFHTLHRLETPLALQVLELGNSDREFNLRSLKMPFREALHERLANLQALGISQELADEDEWDSELEEIDELLRERAMDVDQPSGMALSDDLIDGAGEDHGVEVGVYFFEEGQG